MENVEHFGTLTERMKEFREEVLDEKPYIDAQRAILATLAYKENLNQPRVMVRAKMLEKVLDNTKNKSLSVLFCIVKPALPFSPHRLYINLQSRM